MADAPTRLGPQIVQQQIPIEKLLQQYGKTHLQLVAAEENIQMAQGFIRQLQQQIAERDKTIQSLQTELEEKAKQQTAGTDEPTKEIEAPPEN